MVNLGIHMGMMGSTLVNSLTLKMLAILVETHLPCCLCQGRTVNSMEGKLEVTTFYKYTYIYIYILGQPWMGNLIL